MEEEEGRKDVRGKERGKIVSGGRGQVMKKEGEGKEGGTEGGARADER